MLRHKMVDGKRIYTLDQDETDSHPAKFSPLDLYSDERVRFKIKYNIHPFDSINDTGDSK